MLTPDSFLGAHKSPEVEIYERHLKAAIVPLVPRGESLFLLFYLRVVNDAARWLVAGRWLALHPAGRPLQSRAQCSVSAPPVIPGTATCHTNTYKHKCTHECVLRLRAPPAAATCWFHLNEQNEGPEPLNNACTLHYAKPQVITTLALF